MRKLIERRKCDNCGKVEEYQKEPKQMGGGVTWDWWPEVITTQPPSERKAVFDFCSDKCAEEWLAAHGRQRQGDDR